MTYVVVDCGFAEGFKIELLDNPIVGDQDTVLMPVGSEALALICPISELHKIKSGPALTVGSIQNKNRY